MKEIDFMRFPKPNREQQIGKRTEKHREVARRFDEAFFDGKRETGYGGYSYDGRWQAVAARMAMHYGLADGSRILDVGCAKGFLVKDFRAIGMSAYGMDVSQYAIAKSEAPLYTVVGDALELRTWPPSARYDLIVAINSLHNLDRPELVEVLRSIESIARYKYVVLDAWRTDQERDRMMAWNLTAKTMCHVDDWLALFREASYTGDYAFFIP